MSSSKGLKLDGQIPWYLEEFIVNGRHNEEHGNSMSGSYHDDGVINTDATATSQASENPSNMLALDWDDCSRKTEGFQESRYIKPFIGSEEDLLARLSNQSVHHNGYIFIRYWKGVSFSVTRIEALCYIFSFTSILGMVMIYKKHTSKSRIKTSNTNHSNENKNNFQIHARVEKEEDDIVKASADQTLIFKVKDESSISLSQTNAKNRDNIKKLFLNHVPALAEVVSLSGLDKNKAIELVTKEIFKENRRNTEEMKNNKKEQRRQLELKAKRACEELCETVGATFSGIHLLTCMILGCTTRLLLSNRIIIKLFVMNHRDPASIVDISFEWFSINVCGCLQNCIATMEDDNSWWGNFITPYSYSWAYILSIFNLSPYLGGCIFKLIFYIVLLSSLHRLLRALHCTTLHHVLNLLLFIVMTVKTNFGKTLIVLIIQIFLFNVVACGAAYCFYKQRKDIFDDEFNEMISHRYEEKSVEQCMKETIIQARQINARLYLSSVASAIALGVISYSRSNEM
mmetsp:Transcript_2043/g.2441  ORF Transcript_2043/g.2441 Transcript_2043/m.2441 type:complete len:514 (-) Transcript_2043:831-2372(-)